MLRLIDAAQEAGASAVKLQCYSVEELIALRGDGPAPAPWNDRSMADLYRQAMTPRDWFPKLFRYAEAQGVVLFSSVFGLESLKLLEDCGNPCYKIARLDRSDKRLSDMVKAMGKPALMSTAGRDDSEMGFSMLWCPPNYPSAQGDVHLPYFNQGYYGGHFLGLSSHCMSPELPVAAVARGARLIEMHFELAEEPSELEHDVSLNQYQWAAMVRSIKATEEMLG